MVKIQNLTASPNEVPDVLLIAPPTAFNAEGTKAKLATCAGQGAAKRIKLLEIPYSEGKMKSSEVKQLAKECLDIIETLGVTKVGVIHAELFKYITGAKFQENFGHTLNGVGAFSNILVAPIMNPVQAIKYPNLNGMFNTSVSQITAFLEGRAAVFEGVTLKRNDIYTDAGKAKNALKEWLNEPLLTCDIETTGLSKLSDRLLTISFARNEEEAFCIAIHPNYHSEEEYQRIKIVLRGFFSNYKGTIVGHNFVMFDLAFIVREIMCDNDISDFTVRNKAINSFNIVDSLHMIYLLENSSDRAKLGLKDLSFSRYGEYDAAIDQSKLIMYDLYDVAKYNNLDVSANFYIWNKIVARMAEDGRTQLFEMYKQLAPTLLKVSLTGFVLDLARVATLEEQLIEKIAEDYEVLNSMECVKTVERILNELEARKYNASHVKQKTPDDFDIKFKLSSTAHKGLLLFDVLGLTPFKTSDAGNDSTDKESLNELKLTTTDEEILKIINIMQEYNTAAIVKNTFIRAFHTFSTEFKDAQRLFTSMSLHSTVSGRLTSTQPNLQNLPSNSKFGKYVKNCFTCPPGFVFTAADYSALEDILIANESKCQAKLDVFLKGVDAHSLNAISYFKTEIEARGLQYDITSVESVNSFKEKCLDLRNKGKNSTFALSYGCGEGMIQKQLKCSPAQAKEVFNGYHELYKEIGDYQEANIEFAKANGYVESVYFQHRLKVPFIKSRDSEKASKDSRTLGNFMIQSGSVLLTARLIELQRRIEAAGYDNDIQIANTIYDCVYAYVRDDLGILEWYNNNLIEIMIADYRDDQIVSLGMQLDVGYDWAHLETLPNKCSKDVIAEKLAKSKIRE